MASITTRQLAAMAGCSHATVSLALRNHPRISEATRKKIVDLASASGYSRDPLVSTLMTQLRTTRRNRATEKLAFLTLWDTRDGWRKGHQDTSAFQRACVRAEELGYEIEEFWAKEPGLNAKRLTKILYTRGIRGLLLSTLPRPSGHFSLDWSHFATVTTGSTLLKPDLHRVVHSQFQGMSQLLHELRHLGYRKIGFTSLVDQSERSNQGWLARFLLHNQRQPAALRVPPLIVPKWSPTKALQWIEKHEPDVIVSNIEDPLHLLRDAGFRVPKEIGYASLDRILPGDPYAGIDQLRGEMGAVAVELLISLLEGNQYGLPTHPRMVHVTSEWKPGPTVRRIRSDVTGS
ncbi:LacI family DNA-binding transcriptional regulator [Verrucomicrobium sp. GAS474]|uniref:LacI family DNA-binding transcriptional regulator n=1 Tax=Verrucomicrobium sp. GAS474 TaxID=1882831 RepID=UPI0012FF9A38|nr:LacI family DNA-binding transcriptional regulator [Verrucomicrobium sp. GAS474]